MIKSSYMVCQVSLTYLSNLFDIQYMFLDLLQCYFILYFLLIILYMD